MAKNQATKVHVLIFVRASVNWQTQTYLLMNETSYNWSCTDFYTFITYTFYITCTYNYGTGTRPIEIKKILRGGGKREGLGVYQKMLDKLVCVKYLCRFSS